MSTYTGPIRKDAKNNEEKNREGGQHILQSPPTKIIACKPSNGERRVQFSNLALVKTIPSDQFPARPTRMERSKSNPHRLLWVLHRLFQIGGRYCPNPRERSKTITVQPKTPWPTNWEAPPPSPKSIV